MTDRRDIYGRRATSTSRGRTIQRILDHEHAAGMIPGTESVLVDLPDGSIGATVLAFHAAWVEPKVVTTRRAYERSLAFFVRDLAANGPAPTDPIGSLVAERVVEHLDWRLANGLDDPGELQRAALHLSRLCEWADEHAAADTTIDRAAVRAAAAERIAAAPPPFQSARSADELRDTSGDESALEDRT